MKKFWTFQGAKEVQPWKNMKNTETPSPRYAPHGQVPVRYGRTDGSTFCNSIALRTRMWQRQIVAPNESVNCGRRPPGGRGNGTDML